MYPHAVCTICNRCKFDNGMEWDFDIRQFLFTVVHEVGYNTSHHSLENNKHINTSSHQMMIVLPDDRSLTHSLVSQVPTQINRIWYTLVRIEEHEHQV